MFTKEFSTPPLLWFLRLNRIQGVQVSSDGVVIGETTFTHSAPGAWSRTNWLFWSRLTYVLDEKCLVSFFLTNSAADEFVEVTDNFRVWLRQSDNISEAEKLLSAWDDLMKPWEYVPRHQVQAWADLGISIYADLLPSLQQIKLVEADCVALKWCALMRDPFAAAKVRNDDFVKKELARRDKWFGDFRVPPTIIQREIAIRDETNTLVVAGAGTGKTSTILTKIRYLIESRLSDGSGILVVAFNTDAAQEIRDRCLSDGCENVTILTFHALGLRILAERSGEKPPVLTELQKEEARDELIANLVEQLSEDSGFAEDYARFVLLYVRPSFSKCEMESEAAFVKKTKPALTKSIKGDWVRSTEELRIANWLFLHGITYEYEAVYPHATGAGYTRYRPDFTLRFSKLNPDGGESETVVYLEHQALNEKGEAPAWMKDYKQKVEFRKRTHQEFKTILIESFSWWFSRGIWEVELRNLLVRAGLMVPEVNWRELLRKASAENAVSIGHERKTVNGFLRRVLDLSRSADSPVSVEPKNPADATRTELFQRLFRPVREAYEAYKNRKQGIDFEDMIFLARKTLEENGFKAPWSHYIVDEYQDASLSRLSLILALRQQVRGSRLTCVGDDWQAIIRFAGGDIRVMTEFEKRVGPFWQANLDQAFRYSETIAEVSMSFILENPHQLRKRIKGHPGKNVPIRIILAGSKTDSGDFNDVLYGELERIQKAKRNASVLILSRYRRGIPSIDKQAHVREGFPGLELSWSTVHRAKGREADAVLVGDLNDDNMGFPCLREDDPIIHRYLPPHDSFEHSEERRLFYVALTRAKQHLVLIADASAPSPFIHELVAKCTDGRTIEIIKSGNPAKMCPKCKVGYVVARDGPHGLFYSCTKSPACKHTEQACSSCRRGFLVLEGERYVCSRQDQGCRNSVSVCPRCRQGLLEVRTNRNQGSQFLGCSRFFDEDDPCSYTRNLGAKRRSWR